MAFFRGNANAERTAMQTGGFAAMQRENHPLEGRFRPGDAALHGMVDGQSRLPPSHHPTKPGPTWSTQPWPALVGAASAAMGA